MLFGSIRGRSNDASTITPDNPSRGGPSGVHGASFPNNGKLLHRAESDENHLFTRLSDDVQRIEGSTISSVVTGPRKNGAQKYDMRNGVELDNLEADVGISGKGINVRRDVHVTEDRISDTTGNSSN
jgi:hypothetical protein